MKSALSLHATTFRSNFSLLCISGLFLSPFAKAADPEWNYRGKIVENAASTIYLAEIQLSDDKLRIYYSVSDKNWYMEFRYIDEATVTWNAGFKHPEFFARTNESLNFESGRYDSDYTIKNPFKVEKEGSADVITMVLSPPDVQALMKYHVPGVSYFVSDSGQRHYRFPPTGLSKALKHIQLDVESIAASDTPPLLDRLKAKDAEKYQALVREFRFPITHCVVPTLEYKPGISSEQELSDRIRAYIKCAKDAIEVESEAVKKLIIDQLNGKWSQDAEGSVDIVIPAQYDCNAEIGEILRATQARITTRTKNINACEAFRKKHMLFDLLK